MQRAEIWVIVEPLRKILDVAPQVRIPEAVEAKRLYLCQRLLRCPGLHRDAERRNHHAGAVSAVMTEWTKIFCRGLACSS